jgi:hypothetical protein
VGQEAQELDEPGPLHRADALMEGVLVIVVVHVQRELGDDRAGVHAGVDQVEGRARHLHSVGQRVADAVGTGERGQQRGVRVEDPAGEGLDEGAAQDAHEAGGHDPVRGVGPDGLGECGVPGLARGVVRRRDDEGLAAGGAGTVQDARRGLVGADRDDLHTGPPVPERVEEGLGEGSGAGGKDHASHAGQSRGPVPAPIRRGTGGRACARLGP